MSYEELVELYKRLESKEMDVLTFVCEFFCDNARAVSPLLLERNRPELDEYPFDFLFFDDEGESLEHYDLQYRLIFCLNNMEQNQRQKYDSKWEEERLEKLLSHHYPMEPNVRDEFTRFCREEARKELWRTDCFPDRKTLLDTFTRKYLLKQINSDKDLDAWEEYVRNHDISNTKIFEKAESMLQNAEPIKKKIKTLM